MDLKIKETEALIELSGGDTHKLLSLLEFIIQSQSKNPLELTNSLVFKTVQTNTVLLVVILMQLYIG